MEYSRYAMILGEGGSGGGRIRLKFDHAVLVSEYRPLVALEDVIHHPQELANLRASSSAVFRLEIWNWPTLFSSACDSRALLEVEALIKDACCSFNVLILRVTARRATRYQDPAGS
jgi:hypothetical protein